MLNAEKIIVLLGGFFGFVSIIGFLVVQLLLRIATRNEKQKLATPQHYLAIDDLISLMEDSQIYEQIFLANKDRIKKAPGSKTNHQAGEGGYLDHVQEVMNIACQQYQWMNQARDLPFSLSDALQVLFLHDIEKPYKYSEPAIPLETKAERRAFRAAFIKFHGIKLTPEQENALLYVEGVPDNEYTPDKRTMGELAAFCHCCDVLSARLWHDKGKDVKLNSKRWE